MAQIPASLVKQLRDMTSVGFSDCKKALVEAEGDLEKAVDVLRVMGLAKSVKKAGRDTNEGTIAAYVSEDGKVGALVEVTCETDFVGSNAKFRGFARDLAKVVADCDPADLDAFLACPMRDSNVDECLKESIFVIGENQKISRFVRIATDGALSSYVHHDGKHADIVEFSIGNAETAQNETFKTFAHDVAMQVVASNPVAAKREDVPAETVAHELAIAKEKAANSGKPEAIQERIALGGLEKFYKENVLAEQAFVKDGSLTVTQLAAKVSKEIGDKVELVSFVRFNFGE